VLYVRQDDVLYVRHDDVLYVRQARARGVLKKACCVRLCSSRQLHQLQSSGHGSRLDLCRVGGWVWWGVGSMKGCERKTACEGTIQG
jgi:hypothetical protein